MSECQIRLLIEAKRKLMYSIAEREGFSSPNTVKCSQELDNLLNVLQKHRDKKELKIAQ